MNPPTLVLLAAALAAPLTATAAPPGPAGPTGGPHGGPFPRVVHPAPPGRWIPEMPHRATTAVVAGITYFVLDGIFHKRTPAGYVVVEAPAGAVVKLPPPGYRVVVVGPRTYYVARDTWYRWDDEVEGYLVVERPSTKDDASAKGATATTGGKLYVYPKAGQSDEQLARDRYECHQWAVRESGFDPSLGEPADDGANEEYRRAIGACLEARGYTVR